MKRKIIIGVLILIVVVAGVGYYLYQEKVQNYGKGDADITITAKELIDAFEKDTTAAAKKFMDKKIRVTGTIKNLDSSAIVLEEEGNASSVVVGLDERNKKDVSELKVGEAATLQGKYSGYEKSSGDPDDMLASLGTTIHIDYGGVIKK